MKGKSMLFIVVSAMCLIISGAAGGEDVENGDKMLWAAGKAAGYSKLQVREAAPTEFFADKERMKEVMRDMFREDYPEDKYQAENALMLKFGFGLFEDKSEDEIVDEYTKGILGVYDDKKGKIYVVSNPLYLQLREERYDECNIERTDTDQVWDDWMNKHREDIVLVHEGTHALQDQAFDLSDWHDKYRHNDDAAQAIRAMVEGEAEWVERKFTLEQLKISDFLNYYYEYGMTWDMKIFSKIDERMEEASKRNKNTCNDEMTFLWWMNNVPYVFGLLFMTKVENEQGRDSLNNSFVHCPLSTEQLLNSDKYFNPEKEDRPTFINLPSFDDLIDTSAWRYLDYNGMGMLKLYLLCRDLYFDAGSTCLDTAEGWDGDRYLVWRNEDDEILLTWYTTWDNPDDAMEFYKFYAMAWDRKEISKGNITSGDGWRRVAAGADSLYMEIRGGDVIIIEGPLDEDGFTRFSEKLWTATKYEADYNICTMTAAEFNDKYAGYTGEKNEEVEKE